MKSNSIPKLITKIPGPKASKFVEEDKKYISQSYTRVYPLVVEKAKGAVVTDIDGNQYLDFSAGLGACSTGHCHPKIIKAVTEQSKKLIHMSGTDFYYTSQLKLAKKLNQIIPGKNNKRVFFGNSGTEGVEAAFKLSRYYTKRPMVIAFFGAFHGRTMGSLSLTASKTIQRKDFFPLVPGAVHVPYAHCYRCPHNLTHPKCGIACVQWIEDELFHHNVPPEEVSAIFVEPILGEGGYVVPPKEFHQRLFKIAQKYGILFVADEVQSGIGRTGKFIAIEHFGVTPDIIVLAKGIASGFPLSATIASERIMNWVPGSHASTFGGNPVACEAALATIELIEKSLMKNAEETGNFIISRLIGMEKSHRLIGDVRGKGLMIGVELVKDKTTKERAIKERAQLLAKCFKKGLIILGCGENSIRLIPPLIINKKEAIKALEIFEEALKEVEKS